MKNLIKTFASLILVMLLSTAAYSQNNEKEIIVTRDKDEVAEYVKGEEIYATHSRPYVSANKLRVKAIEKLKEEAKEKGYDVILITKDDFSHAPINNISLVATGYNLTKEE